MSKTLGVYCGNMTGKNLLVTGDQVIILFKSDDMVEQRGYRLVFTLVSTQGKWDHKEADLPLKLVIVITVTKAAPAFFYFY